MAKWRKEVLKLKPDHGWKARPGYNVFVADRGAVRFDYPANWVVIPDTDAIKFYDRQPPDDNCMLQVSFLRLNPAIDWSKLPLAFLVEDLVRGEERDVTSKGPVVEVKRPDLELAWTEIRFTDPNERREACSRLGLGRGANIQPLITMDFWPEDLPRVAPVWDEVLRTLQLGQYVKDPTRRLLH